MISNRVEQFMEFGASRLAISARSSGLGDMINQLVHVMWYAKQTGRLCCVDWSEARYYADEHDEDIFSSFFKCDSVFSLGSNEGNVGDSLNKFGDVALSSLPRNIQESLEPNYIEAFACSGSDSSKDIVKVVRPINFLPMQVLCQFYCALHVSPSIFDSLAKLDFDPTQCIGVHIRHGNGELYSSEEEKILLERFKVAIEQACVQLPRSPIFLATDSKKVEEVISRQFGNVWTTQKYLPSKKGTALHHPASTAETEVSRSEVMFGALRDMVALSKCKVLICDGWSSFTRAPQAWGGFIGDRERLTRIESPRRPAALLKTSRL